MPIFKERKIAALCSVFCVIASDTFFLFFLSRSISMQCFGMRLFMGGSKTQIISRGDAKNAENAYHFDCALAVGSGCGTVDREVASDTDNPGSNPIIGNFY